MRRDPLFWMGRAITAVFDRWAKYYDLFFVDPEEYQVDCDFLERLFGIHARVKPTRILDLGCGTGEHALILSRRGYRVAGLDGSRGMLAEARKKLRCGGPPAVLRLADMRSFRLARKVDAVICMRGTFGYLLRDGEVRRALACIRHSLRPEGLFVFEFWSRLWGERERTSWSKRVRRDTEVARLEEEWTHDRQQVRIRIESKVTVTRGNAVVDAVETTEYLRTYSHHEIQALLHEEGFQLQALYDGGKRRPQLRRPRRKGLRILAVARL